MNKNSVQSQLVLISSVLASVCFQSSYCMEDASKKIDSQLADLCKNVGWDITLKDPNTVGIIREKAETACKFPPQTQIESVEKSLEKAFDQKNDESIGRLLQEIAYDSWRNSHCSKYDLFCRKLNTVVANAVAAGIIARGMPLQLRLEEAEKNRDNYYQLWGKAAFDHSNAQTQIAKLHEQKQKMHADFDKERTDLLAEIDATNTDSETILESYRQQVMRLVEKNSRAANELAQHAQEREEFLKKLEEARNKHAQNSVESAEDFELVRSKLDVALAEKEALQTKLQQAEQLLQRQSASLMQGFVTMSIASKDLPAAQTH